MAKMEDLDNVMDVLNAMEERKKGATERTSGGRTLIGNVDHFFDRLSVAAIKLTGDLRIGDTIEIENEEYTLRQKVSSMQINRKEVDEASNGEDVGVKLSVPVPKGSRVYRMD